MVPGLIGLGVLIILIVVVVSKFKKRKLEAKVSWFRCFHAGVNLVSASPCLGESRLL
jgi:hypothetical protein